MTSLSFYIDAKVVTLTLDNSKEFEWNERIVAETGTPVPDRAPHGIVLCPAFGQGAGGQKGKGQGLNGHGQKAPRQIRGAFFVCVVRLFHRRFHRAHVLADGFCRVPAVFSDELHNGAAHDDAVRQCGHLRRL